MAKFAVEFSPEYAAEIDVGPGGPRMEGMSFDFRVGTEDELRAAIEMLGGVEAFTLRADSYLQARYGVPLTRDGEKVGTATVHVWLDDGMRQAAPVYEAVQALERDRDARRRGAGVRA